MKETEQIARAVLSVFRAQRRSGRESFLSYTQQLAEKILEPIAALYLLGAKRGRAKEADGVAAAARARALKTAREINETTSQWVQEGKADEYVFSVDRAANVALTETNNAVNEGKAIAVKERGGKLRWKIGKKPCKECRALNGKVVRAGASFVRGAEVFAPPLHPNCNCTVSEA